MGIKVICPNAQCAAQYDIPEQSLGKSATCKKCGHSFKLSPAAEAPSSLPPPAPTAPAPVVSTPVVSTPPVAIPLPSSPAAEIPRAVPIAAAPPMFPQREWSGMWLVLVVLAAVIGGAFYYVQSNPEVLNADILKNVAQVFTTTSASGPTSSTTANATPSHETEVNSIGMRLCRIPAGSFQMGMTAEEILGVKKIPQRAISLSRGFLLGAYEVTQGEFEAVMETNPSWFSMAGGGSDAIQDQDTKQFPVEQVSWFDAVRFCNKLSQKEGLQPYYDILGSRVKILDGDGYRLPTEAEWEYACRAGTQTPFHFGSTGNGTEANANGKLPYGAVRPGPHLERTTKVGSYPANAFGLHDMHGNVWEWCWDWEGRYRPGPERDPIGPEQGTTRICRGGSFNYSLSHARAAAVAAIDPDSKIAQFGFRVARFLK